VLLAQIGGGNFAALIRVFGESIQGRLGDRGSPMVV
jgi:hypothetical protein